MTLPVSTPLPVLHQLIVVRPEPPGQFTAEMVGLPEVRAIAADREAALQAVRRILGEWLTSGQLVFVDVPLGIPQANRFSPRDPNDPLEKEYIEDLERFRREDLERTLREYEEEDQACSSSSSTPTT